MLEMELHTTAMCCGEWCPGGDY